MAPPTVRHGSNRAELEVIEISDDEPDCTESSKVSFSQSASKHQDRLATAPNKTRPSLERSINLPHLPPVQSSYELEENESKDSVLVNGNNYNEIVMHSATDRSVSPRLVMSLQSRTSGHGDFPDKTAREMSLEMLDKELSSICSEIEEDQALMTTQLLQDIQHQLDMAERNFSTVACHMTSLESLEPAQKGKGSSTISIVYHGLKKTSPSRLLEAKTIQTSERAVPKYDYYIEIERSILINPMIPHNPYFQDTASTSKAQDTTVDKVSVDAVINKPKNVAVKFTEQRPRNENLSMIGAYLPQIISAHQKCRDFLDKEGIHNASNSKDPNSSSYHVEKAFGIPPGSFLELIPMETEAQKSSPKSPDPLQKTLKTYAQEGCLICSAHRCHIHGKFDDDEVYESDASSKTDEESMSKGVSVMYQLYNMPYTRMRSHYKAKGIARDESESDSSDKQSQKYYCSAACYLDTSCMETNNEGTWTEEEDAVMRVQVSFLRVRKNWRAPCLIARMLRKPCSQVQHQIEKLSSQNLDSDDVQEGDYKGLKKFSWDYFTREHAHDKRRQPMPCHHPGLHCLAAGKKCTCVGNGLMCDKFCACPPNCCARYQGCTCNGPCLLRKCLCRRLNRECDPDLCHGCGAAESVKLQGPVSDISCRNCEIQRAVVKKVLVGESSIEDIGYGLYLAEPVQKGDFIAEYVGEIINEGELDRRSDRRSNAEPRLKASYYFNLNEEMIIDALRFGNTTRFINDSELHKNCEAKVLLVNCEHRIGFFATKNIDAGTEMFFDYGRGFHDNEKLKEGILSSDASRKSSKPQRAQTLAGTIATPKAWLDSALDEEEAEGEEEIEEDAELGYIYDDDVIAAEIEARAQRRRASEDDNDYIEGGSKRSRPMYRNKLG